MIDLKLRTVKFQWYNSRDLRIILFQKMTYIRYKKVIAVACHERILLWTPWERSQVLQLRLCLHHLPPSCMLLCSSPWPHRLLLWGQRTYGVWSLSGPVSSGWQGQSLGAGGGSLSDTGLPRWSNSNKSVSRQTDPWHSLWTSGRSELWSPKLIILLRYASLLRGDVRKKINRWF